MHVRLYSHVSLALIAALLITAPHLHTLAVERSVAITFDDLPGAGAGTVVPDAAGLEALSRKLLSALRLHNVPAIGFVNEAGLRLDGPFVDDRARRVGILRLWLDAGLELGNHTYSHRDLNTTPLDAYEADVVRGETMTRALLRETGRTLRYFRHPLLHVGADPGTRQAFEAFLAERGYIVAPVTVDNDEFVYAAAYAAALRRGDSVGASRVADDYLRYMEDTFAYFEEVSRRTVGREISQILLLHANSLNADRFGALAESLRRRGYRFISLTQALEDPAYRLPDEFTGAPGNSWFNHWEVTAGRQPVPTPAPPSWVTSR